jgi:hypothetical protein
MSESDHFLKMSGARQAECPMSYLSGFPLEAFISGGLLLFLTRGFA